MYTFSEFNQINKLFILIFTSDTRQTFSFAFMAEAFGCRPCSVSLLEMSAAQIVHLLRPNRPQRTKPKKVPEPSIEVEVTTTKHLGPGLTTTE